MVDEQAPGGTFRDVRGGRINWTPVSSTTEDVATRLKPLGGDADVRLLQGLDATVKSLDAVAQEIKRTTREFSIVNERHFQMYGRRVTGEAEATGGLTQESIKDAFKEALADQAAEQREIAAATWLPDEPAAQRQAQRMESPASRGEVIRTEHIGDGAPEATPRRSNWEEYEARRDILGGRQGISLSNVRQSFGEGLQRRLGNMTWGDQLEQSPLGSFHLPTVPGSPDDFGVTASPQQVAQFLRREKVVGALKGGAETLRQGGTLRQAGMNMLPGGAARVLGGVGAAVFAADKVADFAEEQRRQNMEWQRISGGTNFDAFGERAGSRAFAFSQMGVMGEQDAARLYQGVARTGMQGEQRRAAERFATQNLTEFGMTIEQSLEIVNTAARTGQESLEGLSEALRDVTASAADAGVNAEVAREAFVRNWSTFSSTMGGPAAAIAAEGFTQAQMGMGREFQGLDFSGTASPDVMRMLAHQGGQTLNQFLAQTMEPGGQTAFAERWTGHNQDLIARQLGPQGQAILEQFQATQTQQRAVTNPRTGETEFRYSNQQLSEAAQDLLANAPNMDVQALIPVIEQMTGVSGLDPARAMEYLVRIQTGDFDPAREVRERAEMGQTRDLAFTTADVGTAAYAQAKRGNQDLQTEEYRDLTEDVQEETSSWRWGDRGTRKMSRAFLEDVEKTGRAGGISEMIATDRSRSDAIQQVQVETREGTRIVPLDVAMKHFRDQVDAGTAIIAEGSQAGSSVAEALGVEGDAGVEVTSMDSEEAARQGLSAEEWNKQKQEQGGAGGTVVLAPTDELRRLIRVQSSTGNVQYEDGWAPAPAHTTPSTHPTGTPRG